ncbi:hypothetical protein [Frankia sp. Cj5]|uniref:hypothetical protein n=1 Tax=Frankia sp. Cj5 TaxID=2880978 RepID=UPI001EF424DE|nr:hypothetical protein [Frankia sp. Cj5]
MIGKGSTRNIGLRTASVWSARNGSAAALRAAASVVPINGLRAKGSCPGDGAGVPRTEGTPDPGFWSATGNFGGQSETGDQMTSFALCARSRGPRQPPRKTG